MSETKTLDELIDDLVWAEKPEHKCNLCNGHSDTEIEALIKKALTTQIMKHTPEVKSLLEALRFYGDCHHMSNVPVGDKSIIRVHSCDHIETGWRARAALKEWE